MLGDSLPEFADRINEIMSVIIRGFLKRQADELYKGKVTLPQVVILNFLHKQGESKMTDIAHFIDVSTAAVTGIVDRLVRYGYVLRVRDSKDRRIIKIGLTSKGSELVKKVNLQRRKMLINIFGKISQAEREDYLKILMHIRDNLTKQRPDIK